MTWADRFPSSRVHQGSLWCGPAIFLLGLLVLIAADAGFEFVLSSASGQISPDVVHERDSE